MRRPRTPWTFSRLAPAALALVALGACDGVNQFASPLLPGQGGGGDISPPAVTIVQPAASPQPVHPLADSLLVRARITDNLAVDSVLLFGFSRRGDPSLGTDEQVIRFAPKTVVFTRVVRDTLLARYLQPTGDGRQEIVHVVVAAFDAGDNVATDTVDVLLQGAAVVDPTPPTVEIVALSDTTGGAVSVGDSLLVTTTLADNVALSSLTLTGVAERGDPNLGTFEIVPRFQARTVTFEDSLAVRDTTVSRWLQPTADRAVETVRIIATAQDRNGNVAADTVLLRMGDAVAPGVQILDPPSDSIRNYRVGDSVRVAARVTDNVGVDSVRFEGISRRGDPTLGTDQVVVRFTPRVADLEEPDPDTVVVRYLRPTADETKERVSIVVTAFDPQGNATTDTVQISLGGAEGAADTETPVVQILIPDPATSQVFPAGDSIRITARISDDGGVTEVRYIGSSERGDPSLGTDTVVVRYQERVVNFAFPVADTVLTRFIQPTGDRTPERVRLIVTAVDSRGRIGADTVFVTVGDRTAPTVDILLPRGDSISAKPLGDSLLVQARVTDDLDIDSVRFVGFSQRGDRNLGTFTEVVRFNPKFVRLNTITVLDTVLTRFLNATPDTVRDTALVVVTAWDAQGNEGADTARVILGGPEVTLLDLVQGQTIQAGLSLGIRVRARDPVGLVQLRLDFVGAFDTTVIRGISPPTDTLTLDTTVAVPPGTTGSVAISATAINRAGIVGQDGPITVIAVTEQREDTVAPRPTLNITSDTRMEPKDTVFVQVNAQDNSQGSGVVRVGYTVLGISPSRRDTIVQTRDTTFASPRTGVVATTFKFLPFNVDTLNLPDTLVYVVAAFAEDAAGNCAATAGTTAVRCDSLPTGEIVVGTTLGQRVTRQIVAGRTVRLPRGGLIMDAAIDTVRRNLYLSNLTGGRVEIFRLPEERFLPGVFVGSQPWGITINNRGDSLIVGNSGGTNISWVYLGETTGTGPFFEDPSSRLFMPDVVLWSVGSFLDDRGFVRHTVSHEPDETTPNFGDRPQFLAQDFTGRILLSTTTVNPLADFGSVRKVFVPENAVAPEVQLFVEHAGTGDPTENAFIGLAHIDYVFHFAGGPFADDQIALQDHVNGFFGVPDSTYVVGPDTILASIAALRARGSDILDLPGRWSVPDLGFSDTTFVSASGDRRWVVVADGAFDPGRVIMYEAENDTISNEIQIEDLLINAGEIVRGIGLNYDGTAGVARGRDAYFFSPDLRLQGIRSLTSGGAGAGAALHPLHANARSLANLGGEYRPDTHLAFVGTGELSIDILDTFHPESPLGRIFIKNNIAGPLRAVLPFPEDNVGFTCTTQPVTDRRGNLIGEAVEIFQGGDFNTPHPASGGASADGCIVLKLFGITDGGGVVVVDVRKADILRDHPARRP